jgi:putative sigma-54 modulation protein
MNLQITARHFSASSQLHENLRESFERISRFNDRITGAHVVLDGSQPGAQKAEAVVHISDKDIVAHAEDPSMGKAIEAMLEKLERQLKKQNEKVKGHKSIPMSEAAN